MTIRILLVDDHENIRAGLRMMLKRSPQFEIVGEAENGKQALELVQELGPDLLLLDVEMPGMKGYEVARKIMDAGYSARVLALSGYDEKRYILGMFSNGAVGYLTKDEAPDYLVSAVQEIFAGKKGWISPRVAARLGIPPTPVGWEAFEPLTDLETQILRCLREGNTAEVIATQLNQPLSQVEDGIASAAEKLGAPSRLEAVLRALQEDLI